MNTSTLLAENKQLKEQILILQDQLVQLNRMIFGRKSERFVYEENQLSLFGNEEDLAEVEAPQLVETTIASHTRKINKNHPGRSIKELWPPSYRRTTHRNSS